MSEKNEARRDGAKLQRNSGRGDFAKGDAKWRGFLVDYKEYPKGFRLDLDAWAKVCTDTYRVDHSLMPLLKVILGEGRDKVRLNVIAHDDLEALLDIIDHLQKRVEDLENE